MLSSVVTMHPTPIAPYVPGATRTPASCAAASSSLSLPAKTAAKRTFTAKRKRDSDPADDSGADSSQPSSQKAHRDGPKKKKANRACFHCQKSHLTCDDSRPCQRCVKRGMAEQCKEGHRKKAKYLLDEEELEELAKNKPSKRASKTSTPPPPPPPAVLPLQTPVDPPPLATADAFPVNDPLFNLAFDPSLAFGSEAANLEYSILSAILGNPDTAPAALDIAPVSGLDSRMSPEPYAVGLVDGALGVSTGVEGSPEPYMQGLHDAVFSPLQASLTLAALSADPTDDAASAVTATDSVLNLTGAYRSGAYSRAESPQLSVTPSDTELNGRRPADDLFTLAGLEESLANGVLRHVQQRSMGSPPASQISTSPSVAEPDLAGTGAGKKENVYDCVKKAYDYTPGYHALMKHLPSRFEKNDILRIVRALAVVRPSLIALQMPLSEEDEVFVEKCFQRSLLEYEKLITFTGTPTVAWRRTGEICLVGAEFSMLTDWTRDELIGAKKYIWEIFDTTSAVEYWENFASHAFENTTQSVYSQCVLLKPDGSPVPCTFCFSIRRDIFDLPSLVVGQWLPLS